VHGTHAGCPPSLGHQEQNGFKIQCLADRCHTGQIFDYPVHLTWEFTSSNPIRSVFPLWPVYGLPMLLLRWVWTETGQETVAPTVTFYTLRGLMFLLSLVLEDWAIHELIQSRQRQREAIVLVASSYVTWTYQTHTFSNAGETLLVAWSLVLIQRIIKNKVNHPKFFNQLFVDTQTAEIVHLLLGSSSFSCRLRPLQSYYLPRLRFNTRLKPSAPFPSQVSSTYHFVYLGNN